MCVLGILAFAIAIPAVAGDVPLRELPPLLRVVSDEPGVLSLAEGQTLSRRIEEIEHDTGVKMIAVVVVTVVPESVEAYTQRLINHWKRHSRALDNDRFRVHPDRQERSRDSDRAKQNARVGSQAVYEQRDHVQRANTLKTGQVF